MSTDYSGQTLENRYSVIKLLGKGGMGSVYLGKHTKIGKRVAVKFLHSQFTKSPDLVKRFYREAQAASLIQHRNIINVLDVGVSENGEPYLVMEYLEGESLSDMLTRKGPLDVGAACGVLEPALFALSAAHDSGIIHRDLKPENIFLVHENGELSGVKLIDFGISKFTGPNDQSQLTQTGTLLGTPAYMAPEQVRGDKDIDIRADIYSMGVILYEMLTMKKPFGGQHYNELLVNVLTADPILPTTAHQDFPPEAEPLIMEMLSRDRDQRPESAQRVLQKMKALNGYKERSSQLTLAASGLVHQSYASGDLGTPSDLELEDRDVAAEVLLDMGIADTNPEWSDTDQKPATSKKIVMAVSVLAIGLVALLVAVIVLLQRTQAPVVGATVPVSPPAAPSGEKNPVVPPVAKITTPTPNATAETIQISVTDLPEGATIYYDNAPIHDNLNPFTVTREKRLVKFEVRAPGYIGTPIQVMPDTNLVLPAKLEKSPSNKTEKRQKREPARKPPKEKKSPEDKKPEGEEYKFEFR